MRAQVRNTLQHTSTHCNTLQHTATHCNTLQHTATHCHTLHITLQHTATTCNTTKTRRGINDETKKNGWFMCYSVLQCVAMLLYRSLLQAVLMYIWCMRWKLYVAVCCSVLQCVAVCCSVLQTCATSFFSRWYCCVFYVCVVEIYVLQCVAVCCSSVRQICFLGGIVAYLMYV